MKSEKEFSHHREGRYGGKQWKETCIVPSRRKTYPTHVWLLESGFSSVSQFTTGHLKKSNLSEYIENWRHLMVKEWENKLDELVSTNVGKCLNELFW